MTNLFKDNLYQAFKGKKVIVTGHTGFKGSWLTTWLNALGADVTGISINVPTSPSNFKANQLQTKINDIRCDVTDLAKTMKLIKRLKPDFVLLDEPFAGVDPIAVEDIQQMIISLKQQNIGVLITDHNVRETLSITDRSYLLYGGKILKSGDAQTLANDEEVRRIYLGKNFKLDQ